MAIYRVQLEVRSRLATPLAADTLWGHVAWGIRWRDGERALVDWLAAYDAGHPPLVLSDPMPSGFFPRPMVPPAAAPNQRPSDSVHDAWKRVEKMPWVAHADWTTCARGLGPASLQAAIEAGIAAGRTPPQTTSAATVHAGINRFTGGTALETGGLLFSSDEVFHENGAARYDVWVRSPDSRDDVATLFEAALHGGYGRDAATGAGEVRLVSVEPASLPAPGDANAGVLLGPAAPAPGDPTQGFFSVGVRAGRLGGEFATGATPSGSTERQKRPVHCLLRGSILVGRPPAEVFGRVVSGVHEDPVIRHYAMTLLLPCRLDASVLAEVVS